MNTNTFTAISAHHMAEIELYLPKFAFYRQVDNVKECYCTACHEWFDIEKRRKIKHNECGECKYCGAEVQFKEMYKGRKSYRYKQNFAVFTGSGNEVKIHCYIAHQSFSGDPDELIPEVDLELVTWYRLTPGKAEQYYFRWMEGWKLKASKPTEPVFNNRSFGYPADRSYYIIGDDCLLDTYLRFHVTGLPEKISSNIITYLCACAIHPNLEYLVKGGFFELAKSYVAGKSGLRINWRSNNPLKMLRLNRTELKYLMDCDTAKYKDYIYFRGHIYGGGNTKECINHFEDFRNVMRRLLRLCALLPDCPYKEITKYISKQGKRNGQDTSYTIHDWLDYLNGCQNLQYNLSDAAVSMPRDLSVAHDRITRIVKYEHDKALAEILRKSDEARANLPYTDVEKGLEILLPKSIDEIVAEGRALSHCVGGYADRHATGKLHILFLRKTDEPEKPYYTMEVSTQGVIVQCRGYKNNYAGNPKPPEIEAFETEYQEYLNTVFRKGVSV